MKEYGKAQTAFEMALALDGNNAEAKEGLMNAIRNNDESPEKARERALHDPEVQEILRYVVALFVACVFLASFCLAKKLD